MQEVPREEEKIALRKLILARRDSLSQAHCISQSQLIQNQALRFPPYLASREVGLYSPIRGEVKTDKILKNALRAGRQVFYPRISSESSVEFIEVVSATDLKTGHFGILEPTGLHRWSATDHEKLFVFVPGLAFDPRGYRLGWGKGWYDRVLKQVEGKAVFAGLAYDFQILEKVPTEPWDQSVQYIITERRTIDCTASRVHSSRTI